MDRVEDNNVCQVYNTGQSIPRTETGLTKKVCLNYRLDKYT